MVTACGSQLYQLVLTIAPYEGLRSMVGTTVNHRLNSYLKTRAFVPYGACIRYCSQQPQAPEYCI